MEPDADRLAMEVAHVLYLDMVGYSRLPLDVQARFARELRDLVRATPEFAQHEAGSDLLRLDTGDGMALVFFGDPQSPIRCACAIAQALGTPPRLPLRIGLHSGPVIRTLDINGRENANGSGIDTAQRIMDCGDAGHILLSRSYADLLKPLDMWASNLHDLGETVVKHGQQLFLVNFHGADCGNPAPPKRLRLPSESGAASTNLPFWRPDQFVGRAPTLARVHDLLQASAPVALVGLSGLGKTQLALQYAHLHPQDYPGGVFWINAADSGRLKEDYVTVGRSFFGIPESLSTESCVARLRDRLHHLTHPALFVFDNVTADTDFSLLPTSPQCRLLLTAQQKHLAPPGFELVELPKLEPEAALTLLGASRPHLAGADLAAARQLADDLGRLPIALALLAQHRTRLGIGFAAYRARLVAPAPAAPLSEQRLLHTLERAREKFVAATGHKGRLYETIERSYVSLDPAARAVLAAAACFAAAGLGRDLLLDVLGPDENSAWEEALADLADASLISEDELPAEVGSGPAAPAAPRLRLHELVRLFARMQLSEEQRRAHVARLSEVLADRLQAANDKMDWRGVRAEMPHLAHAASECRLLEMPESLYPLLIARGQFFLLHRDFANADADLRDGLALVERLHGPLHRSRAQALRLRGEAAQMQGDGRNALRDAWTALRVAKRLFRSDNPDLPVYYTIVGFILKEQGRYTRARLIYNKAYSLYVRMHGAKHPEVADCLNNLGLLYAEQGDLEKATECLSQAVAIERLQTNPHGLAPSMAVYWTNLGRVLALKHEWSEALECHQAALKINQDIHGSSHPTIARCLYYSGVACHGLQQWEEAAAFYQQALRLYQQLFGDDDSRVEVVREKLETLEADRRES